MDKFNRTLHGYDPVEVNTFLDNVIVQVEKIINASKTKDMHINELEKQLNEYSDKLKRYQNMEDTLRQAIIMAQKTSEQMKLNTIKESELILEDAKRNANRIVNDALIRADNALKEAETLKRNTYVFKRKLKEQLETQLELVNDIEIIEFDNN